MTVGGEVSRHIASPILTVFSPPPHPHLRSGASLEASAPQAAASRRSLGIPARAGREGAAARVPCTLSRPPCLAAPLRPGKEGARAARPLRHPRTALSPGGRRGRAWGRGGTGESLPQPRGLVAEVPVEGSAPFPAVTRGPLCRQPAPGLPAARVKQPGSSAAWGVWAVVCYSRVQGKGLLEHT